MSPDIASSFGVGMVHQEFRLIESFTIKDNLTLSKANIFSDNFEEAYEKYSEIFTLNSSYLTPISELSVGEKQKVEIMKLIFKNSEIMLLDEPTAVLTPQETLQLKESLDKLSQEDNKTIVLITHKLKEIKEFTEIVSVMKNGKMVAEDLATKDVTDNQLIELMMGTVKTSTVNKNNEVEKHEPLVKKFKITDGQVKLENVSSPATVQSPVENNVLPDTLSNLLPTLNSLETSQ